MTPDTLSIQNKPLYTAVNPPSTKSKGIYNGIFVGLMMSVLLSLLSLNTSRLVGAKDISFISFFAIGVYSSVCLYSGAKRHPFTLNCAHWVFVFFFFFYAPFVQFLVNFPPQQTNIGAFKNYHVMTNMLILGWCLCYSLTYRFSYRLASRIKKTTKQYNTKITPHTVLLILLSAVAILIIFRTLGMNAFLSRGSSAEAVRKQEVSKTAFLIVIIFCRALPVMAFGQMLISLRGKKLGNYAALFVLGLASLASNHVLNVPRFWFGTLLIGVICIIIRRRQISGIWLPTTLCLAFIYLMPILNIGRAELADMDLTSGRFYDVTRVLVGADFDAYSMYANTLKYVDDKDYTYGNQILGTVFFYVPRAMWKDKPEGSSTLIAEKYNTFNKNLSMPLPAEGYIDFGILGTFAYAIGFAFLLARLDNLYWRSRSEMEAGDADAPLLINLVYPFLIGMVIFMMRGSLNSSFAFSCGLVVAGWVTQKIAFFAKKKTIARKLIVPPSTRQRPLRNAQ